MLANDTPSTSIKNIILYGQNPKYSGVPGVQNTEDNRILVFYMYSLDCETFIENVCNMQGVH